MGGDPENRCVGRLYGSDGANRCVGHVCGADGARHHPNRTHELSNGSQDHQPSTKCVHKTICCNLTSSSPDDGRMRPKHIELRKLQ